MRTLAALAVFLLVAACQAPPSEMTEAEIAQIEAEVEAYIVEYVEIWEALDLERTPSLNVQGPEFTWATGGAITRGSESNRENAEALYSSVEAVEWVSTDRHIAVLSRDAAAFLDVGKMAVNLPGGVTSEATYTYSYVLVRRDGEWKTLLGHGSFEEG